MRKALASAALVSLLFATFLSGNRAHAQQQRIGGQRFYGAGSEDGIFETEGADRRRILWPYVALWAHYTWNPVVMVDGNATMTASPIEHVVAADLVASLAVWEGLEFGFVLPVTLWSGGDAVGGVPSAPGTALGDIQLRAAYRIRLAEHTALAFHAPVLFPSNASDNMLALGWGFRPTVAFMQRAGPVEILINAFVLIREDADVLPPDYTGGHEFGARLGFRFDVSGRWMTALLLEGGFSSAFRDFFGLAETPAEVRFGLEHWFDEHWRISGFVGTGIGPGVGAPDFRGGFSVAFGDNVPWRPRPSQSDGDRDGDGIRDDEDRCPYRAEDYDGVRDHDGCPESDSDRDGVLDWEDRCPTAPEDDDQNRDRDGCPRNVRVERGRIVTFDEVHFRPGSDEILERSHPMLREVAGVMRENEDMVVRVDGHTDSDGGAQANLVLSRQRAASVRRYLMSRGISGNRLRSRGFGEARPDATNRTARGRFQNRRVEFIILRD